MMSKFSSLIFPCMLIAGAVVSSSSDHLDYGAPGPYNRLHCAEPEMPREPGCLRVFLCQ